MIMESSVIFSLLRILFGQLPILIVLLSAIFIMFNRVTPGKLRNIAITGLIILLVELFFRLLASVLPWLLWERGSIGLQSVMSGLYMMISLLHASGLGLLAWALIKALPQKQSNTN